MRNAVTYLRTVVVWSLALALLLATLLATARTPADALRDLPTLFATMFPLAALAGGAMLTTRDTTRGLFAVGLLGAIVAFLLSGFLAPWLESALGATDTASTFPTWVQEHRSLLAARAGGEPVLGWMITVSGLHLWQPVVAAGLAFVLTPLGALAAEGDGLARRWTAMAVLLAVVTLAHRFVLALALEDGGALAIGCLTVVAIPALMLAAALWTRAAVQARA